MTESNQLTEDLIRSAGLRRTSARVAVLNELIAAGAPLSHAEMTDRLEPMGIDQATVFRNLNDLTDAGLLVRAELGDHVWRFEYRDPEDSTNGTHPHFICTDCGTVACLNDVKLTTATRRRTNQIGTVNEIVLKGQCVECHEA